MTLYSRQGTTETIEEVEDEQDQLEDKAQAPSESQQFDDSQAAEYSPWSDGEPGEMEEREQEGTKSKEEAEGTPDQESKETEMPPWGLPLGVEEAESALSVPDKEFTTESDDGEEIQDFLQTERKAGLLYTPDTDASKTSDTDVPPSYSKAVSFDHLVVSDDDDDSDTDRRRRMVMTSDSRSDSRSDIMLPSMTTELTASELLLNK